MSIRTLLIAACAALAACAAAPTPPSAREFAPLDTQIRELMRSESVEGLAVAVIDEGAIRHVAAFGRRSVERDLPLTPETTMYGASLTKAAFAYLVLKLVDQGRLRLDAPLTELLPHPLPSYSNYSDLAGDDRWRALTPRILLTHRSGFANFRWIEPDRKLRFHFAPGERYAYSGEGIYLLQFVLEKGLGFDVGLEMQRQVFDALGMTGTAMSWRDSFAANLADGYSLDGKMEPHDRRDNVSAAGSMDTTIADQARLWAAVVRGDGLTPASRAELTRAHAPIHSAHQFPTLSIETDARNQAHRLGAGLGVVTFEGPAGRAWFKGGHNDTTGNMVICLERGKRCVVLLSNDVRAERIYPRIVKRVLGDIGMPWYWEYNHPPPRP